MTRKPIPNKPNLVLAVTLYSVCNPKTKTCYAPNIIHPNQTRQGHAANKPKEPPLPRKPTQKPPKYQYQVVLSNKPQPLTSDYPFDLRPSVQSNPPNPIFLLLGGKRRGRGQGNTILDRTKQPKKILHRRRPPRSLLASSSSKEPKPSEAKQTIHSLRQTQPSPPPFP